MSCFVVPSDAVLKWSHPETWKDVEKGWGGFNCSIPGPGEDVIILPSKEGGLISVGFLGSVYIWIGICVAMYMYAPWHWGSFLCVWDTTFVSGYVGLLSTVKKCDFWNRIIIILFCLHIYANIHTLAHIDIQA